MGLVFFLAKKGGVHIAKIILGGAVILTGTFLAGRASKRPPKPPEDEVEIPTAPEKRKNQRGS
jgi:hypothetical protein